MPDGHSTTWTALTTACFNSPYNDLAACMYFVFKLTTFFCKKTIPSQNRNLEILCTLGIRKGILWFHHPREALTNFACVWSFSCAFYASYACFLSIRQLLLFVLFSVYSCITNNSVLNHFLCICGPASHTMCCRVIGLGFIHCALICRVFVCGTS